MVDLFIKARRFKAAVLSTAVAFTLASCATTGQGGGGISRTVLQGCAGGAALGALTGALLSQNRAQGALIGGGVGALLGCTAGGILNERRKRYRNEAEFYDAQIDQTKSVNRQLAQLNADLSQRIASNRANIAKLKRQRSQAKIDKSFAQAEFERANESYQLAKSELDAAKKEVTIQETVITELKAKPAGNAGRIQTLSADVASMRAYVQDLETQVDTLAQQRDAIGQFS